MTALLFFFLFFLRLLVFWRQVYPGALRHIRAGGRSEEWKPPAKQTIEKASTNGRQVARPAAARAAEQIFFLMFPNLEQNEDTFPVSTLLISFFQIPKQHEELGEVHD